MNEQHDLNGELHELLDDSHGLGAVSGVGHGLPPSSDGGESKGLRGGIRPLREMRILTVRQPFAWAIIHGGKTVENRTRNIAGAYRGPVAIHAGAGWDWDTELPVGETPHPTSLVRGAIIGVVDLVNVHSSADCWRLDLEGESWCSVWAEPNRSHLALRNPRPLAKPIPYRGALGLRRLDDATRVAVMEAIA